MWRSISSAFTRPKRQLTEQSTVRQELSDDDDETSSTASDEEALECPICWESFNIVENVPYVLWCGHTLCKNCLFGLHGASVKFSNQEIQIPFFISCPWCHLLTFRLVYRGNLKFPSKNFFLLWIVESRNGDRVMKSPSAMSGDHQQIWSPGCSTIPGNNSCNPSHVSVRRHGYPVSNSGDQNRISNTATLERPHFSLHKSLDFFIRITSKFPLVIILLLVVMFVLPTSVAILAIYLVITTVFALPSLLVLYFAYPSLDWLMREIAT